MTCWYIKGKGWRYQFMLEGTKYNGQWFSTKGESRTAREEHRKRLKAEKKKSESPPSWDFDSLVIEYLPEAQRKYQPKTWKYKRYVFQCFRDHAGNLALDEITPFQISQYLLTRPSNYNSNFHRKDLSALFNWAVSKGLMADNPCLKVDRLKHDPGEIIHITEEEWNRFLIAAGEDRPFFLTVFYTLGRVGEIYRLKWSDLDWKREEIRLWTRKRKGGQMEEDWLSMPPELRDTLWTLFRRKDRHEEWVFPNPRTGHHYHQRRKILKTACNRAGIRQFGYHAIRHMGADWLMNWGEDLRTISRFVRHKSLATTETYLRRRPDESLKRAAHSLQNRNSLTDSLTKQKNREETRT